MNDPGVITYAPTIARRLADAAPLLTPETLQDRARGVMLGLAAGNLLGLDVEGYQHDDIAEHYPDGFTEIDPREAQHPMDDDLAQAVELAEALRSDGDYVREFADRLVVWARENGRGMGGATRRAIRELGNGAGVPDAARRAFEHDPIAPNGGVMRCALVAIARRRNPELLVRDSAATCVVTHYAATCQWSCIVVNAIIALFLDGAELALPAIYAEARADGCPDLLEISYRDDIPADALAAVAHGSNPPAGTSWLLCDHRLEGHTLLAMQFGLWAATTPLSLEDALIASVEAGGDTDTNAAVAGAVLGARYGASAIPQRWLDCIPQRERIERLADGLLAVAGGAPEPPVRDTASVTRNAVEPQWAMADEGEAGLIFIPVLNYADNIYGGSAMLHNDDGITTDAPQLAQLLAEAIAAAPNLDLAERAQDTVLADRGRGMMLGLACGNLLGLPVEGRRHYDIARRYPDGVIFIDQHERNRDMDDDLAQAVELAEALRSNGDYVQEFADRLVVWAQENGRGMGRTTRRAIKELREGAGVPDAAQRAFEQNPIAPNGGVMRCAPVAIARRRNPELLVRDAAATCAVTHYASACQWSCIIVNAIIALFLNDVEPDLPAIYAAARADGCPDLLEIARQDEIPTDVLAAVVDGSKPPTGTSWLHRDHGFIGHTLLTMQFGLWAATTPLSLEDALIASVGAGGDTDTNAAVAGAVLGARYGASAIPQRWLDCIPQRERIEGLADGLLALSRD